MLIELRAAFFVTLFAFGVSYDLKRRRPLSCACCGQMVCARCGSIGPDVQTDWSAHVNKRHV
jgi:hypothetical protein